MVEPWTSANFLNPQPRIISFLYVDYVHYFHGKYMITPERTSRESKKRPDYTLQRLNENNDGLELHLAFEIQKVQGDFSIGPCHIWLLLWAKQEKSPASVKCSSSFSEDFHLGFLNITLTTKHPWNTTRLII